LVEAGLALGALVAAFVATCGGSPDDTPAAAATAAGEIFLQPASSSGPDAFSNDVSTLVPGGVPVIGEVSTIALVDTSDGDATVEGTVTISVSSGTNPGLYGGTSDDERCDREAMISCLDNDAAKAAAWADARGIPQSEIATFIRSLTPVTLLHDTRVTNHGFRNDQANAFQAMLEAGTSVLVDDTGTPRARCACGNPLLSSVAQTHSVTYTGEAWGGFSPERVTVGQAGPPARPHRPRRWCTHRPPDRNRRRS